jgi:membrane fusion protein (multidrug efflux system)
MYSMFTKHTSGAILLALTLLVSACGDPTQEAEVEQSTDRSNLRTVRVNTIELEMTSFEDIVPLTGVVASSNDAMLSAQTAGTITELVRIGDTVEEGGVVAKLDDRLVRAVLEQTRATRTSVKSSADLAEDLFRRQEPLYRDSIISALEFENVRSQVNQARAALAQAEAAVSQAEQQLENTFVRAPFSGRVESLEAEQGEQVVPGMSIARIVDTNRLKVLAGVPERYAADIRLGTPVKVSFKAYGGDVRSAKITFVGNVIDPKNRSFKVEIDLANDGSDLKPEMIVDILITRAVLRDQLVVPQTAIIRDEQGTSVYVVDTSGPYAMAKRFSIETGPSYGGQTVITSGLNAGQSIITVGQGMVSEGDKVEVASDAS